MTDKQPSQNAMDKIMSGQVKQVPRWHFVVRNVILWTLGIISISLGALTVSLIIFTLANSTLAMRGIAYQSFWQHTIVFLPILWIGGTLLFVGLFKLFVRHTKRGYKFSLTMIILASFLSSILLGVVFYFGGVSHMIDDALGSHFRAYHSVEKRQGQIFDNPEKGLLIGQIISVGDEEFALVTPTGVEWSILNEKIPAFKKESIAEGKVFIVLGERVEDGLFVACDLRNRQMAGRNKQVQQRHMERMKRMNCNEDACSMHQHMRNLPQNIDVLVKKACTQIK